MVFTQREHFNILDNNEFIMVFMENSPIDEIPNVLFIAFGEIHQGLGVSIWGLPQPLSVRILSNTLEDCFHSSCKFRNSFLGLFR